MSRPGWAAANSGPDYRADRPVTIAGFLSARLDEDEAAAKAAPGSTWHAFGEDDIAGASVYDGQWLLLSPARYEHDNALSSKPGATGPQYIQRARDELCAHVARHDPARVLREVAAKRATLAEHPRVWPHPDGPRRCSRCVNTGADGIMRLKEWPCPTLRQMGAAYCDHPDYNPAWRPR